MNALNQIIIEGNVVRQPEKKEFQNGIKVCTVPIAVNRYYKPQNGQSAEEVSFFDISTFGQLADACEKWCPKGRGIRVVGRLKQDSWKNEEGKTRKMTAVQKRVQVAPEVQTEKRHLLQKNRNWPCLPKPQKLPSMKARMK